jgi:photosystem I subunit 11
MAHGFWLIGPFTKLGPLRDTDVANLAGLLGTLGMVAIMTASMALYSASNPPQPVATTTTGGQVPSTFKSQESWNNYISGFLIGGIGGAVFAYFVLANIAFIKNAFGGFLS